MTLYLCLLWRGIDCLFLLPRYKTFWPKRTPNKMYSLVLFTFDVVELRILTQNDKPCTRATELCKGQSIRKNSCCHKNFLWLRKLRSKVTNHHVHCCGELLGLVLGLEKRFLLTSLRRRCMSCYFLVISQKQQTLLTISTTLPSHRFVSS